LRITIISKGHKPLYTFKDSIVTYSKGYLCKITEQGKIDRILRVPMGYIGKLCRFRITERLFRLEPRCLCRISTNIFVLALKGSIYYIDLQKRTCIIEKKFRKGMSCPLVISKILSVPGFDDRIAYGEYWLNKDREEVSIYTRNLQEGVQDWSQQCIFKKGEVKHIHNIIPDKKNACVYVLTGDENNESGIWRFTNNFNKRERLLVGRQEYRSCVAKPEKDGITYVTDSPDKSNGIYFYNLNGKSLTKLEEIKGSCIFGKVLNNGNLIFSTAVESEVKNKWIDLITYRIGRGIKDRSSHVYYGNIECGFSEIMNAKKDVWPMGLFQFGSFSFIENDDGTIYAYGTALTKFDNVLFKIDLEGEGNARIYEMAGGNIGCSERNLKRGNCER